MSSSPDSYKGLRATKTSPGSDTSAKVTVTAISGQPQAHTTEKFSDSHASSSSSEGQRFARPEDRSASSDEIISSLGLSQAEDDSLYNAPEL